MKLTLILVIVASVAVSGRARHTHSSDLSSLEATDLIEIPDEYAADEIVDSSVDEIRHFKPTRFVPINNEIFFKGYPPCEEGFVRDLLGICREVWD